MAGVSTPSCTELLGGAGILEAWQASNVVPDGTSCGDLVSLDAQQVRTEGAVYDTSRGWFAGTTGFEGEFETERCIGSFALEFETRHGTTVVARLRIE